MAPNPEKDSKTQTNENKKTISITPKSKLYIWLGIIIFVTGFFTSLIIGPRIAHMLPAGLEPVAQFLSPGGAEQRARLDALEHRFETQLEILKNTKVAEIDSEIKTALTTLQNTDDALFNKLSALNTNTLQSNLSDNSKKITALLSALDQINARLSKIEQKTADRDDRSDNDPNKPTQPIKSFDQLRKEVTTKSSAQVITSPSTPIKKLETEHLYAEIKQALAQGRPFTSALQQLQLTDKQVPDALVIAAKGSKTLSDLKAEFPTIARIALKTSSAYEHDDTITGALNKFIKSQITVRSLEPQSGNSTDAILSRMEAALNNNNLSTALLESQNLLPQVKETIAGWLNNAKITDNAKIALARMSQ